MIWRYSELFVSAWFRGCIMTRGTRGEYAKHPHVIYVYSTIRRNGCLCGCFTHANTLDCTTQGGFNHPRVSNDHAQSTAILGSVGKVDFLRRFCMRFQFFQIIPETMRRQDSANYPFGAQRSVIYRVLGSRWSARFFAYVPSYFCKWACLSEIRSSL